MFLIVCKGFIFSLFGLTSCYGFLSSNQRSNSVNRCFKNILIVRQGRGDTQACGVNTVLLSMMSDNDVSKTSTPPTIVEVYSTIGCKYCRMAKAKLDELSVNYTSILITDDDENDKEIQITGSTLEKRRISRKLHARGSTVPQIYVDEIHVGGCDSLLKSIGDGSFFNVLKQHYVSFTLADGLQSLLNTVACQQENIVVLEEKVEAQQKTIVVL